MGRPGPKPPLDGAALEFAQDCARLMTAELTLVYERRADGSVLVRAEAPSKEIVDEAGKTRSVKQLLLSDIPTAELRALAARYHRRTFDAGADEHWMHAGNIPAHLQSSLTGLQIFLHREVLRRIDHPGGFAIEDGSPLKDVAVLIVEGLLRSKLSEREVVATTGAPWSVNFQESDSGPATPRKPTREESVKLRRMHARGAILSVPSVILPSEPSPLPKGEAALRSRLPEVAVLELLVSARYWPFARCTRCRTVFVPGRLGQQFCSRRCGRADNYAKRMLAATPEAAQRRRDAVETAKAHAETKRRGMWQRVRAPGAGRPRKQKEG